MKSSIRAAVMEVSVGGRSNNCKASLTAAADPWCNGTAVMVLGKGNPHAGVVGASFIGVGCVSSSSSWDGPSCSARPRSGPQVCPPCRVVAGAGGRADHRVDRVFSSSWDGPSCSARPRSGPQVCPPCRVVAGAGGTADHRVDRASSSTPRA